MSDTTQDAKRRELRAAPIDQYPEADRAFFRFWYGHMVGDLMQPPLAGIRHSTARYIWDAAIRQAMGDDAAGVPVAHPTQEN